MSIKTKLPWLPADYYQIHAVAWVDGAGTIRIMECNTYKDREKFIRDAKKQGVTIISAKVITLKAPPKKPEAL